MEKLICNLAAVPLRREPADRSEMVNQLLFGEIFEALDGNEKWTMVRSIHDGYEGWVDKKQLVPVEHPDPSPRVATSTFFAARNGAGMLQFLPAGSLLHNLQDAHFTAGAETYELPDAAVIAQPQIPLQMAALLFFGTPYLWGGRTMWGMDCSGYTQIVFRMAGQWIPRDAWQQSEQGDTINFVEETRTGDLAFFDNAEGKITHVGIVMAHEDRSDRHVIHCSGRVRLDRFDHQGIYNLETNAYSHNLRLIRRLS